MAFVIFDLDGTVIDSNHRHLSLPDGSVDLAHWFENATPEKIALDTLLPLARAMRRMYAAGHTVIVCTARTMGAADFQFLVDNDLPSHKILCRRAGDIRPDAEMKVDLLERYLDNDHGYSSIREANCVMFEDNLKVINAMQKHDVMCFDATVANRKMRAL